MDQTNGLFCFVSEKNPQTFLPNRGWGKADTRTHRAPAGTDGACDARPRRSSRLPLAASLRGACAAPAGSEHLLPGPLLRPQDCHCARGGAARPLPVVTGAGLAPARVSVVLSGANGHRFPRSPRGPFVWGCDRPPVASGTPGRNNAARPPRRSLRRDRSRSAEEREPKVRRCIGGNTSTYVMNGRTDAYLYVCMDAYTHIHLYTHAYVCVPVWMDTGVPAHIRRNDRK